MRKVVATDGSTTKWFPPHLRTSCENELVLEFNWHVNSCWENSELHKGKSNFTHTQALFYSLQYKFFFYRWIWPPTLTVCVAIISVSIIYFKISLQNLLFCDAHQPCVSLWVCVCVCTCPVWNTACWGHWWAVDSWAWHTAQLCPEGNLKNVTQLKTVSAHQVSSSIQAQPAFTNN